MTRPRQSVKSARPFACSITGTTLTIGGTRYEVERIPAGEFGDAALLLTKSDGDSYAVIRTHAGLIECDCPSFEFGHRGLTAEPCKHGRAVRDLGLFDRPPTPSPTPRPRRPFGAGILDDDPAALLAPAAPADPAPAPTRRGDGPTALDVAYEVGYHLGGQGEDAMPSGALSAAERAAWLTGYAAGARANHVAEYRSRTHADADHWSPPAPNYEELSQVGRGPGHDLD